MINVNATIIACTCNNNLQQGTNYNSFDVRHYMNLSHYSATEIHPRQRANLFPETTNGTPRGPALTEQSVTLHGDRLQRPK